MMGYTSSNADATERQFAYKSDLAFRANARCTKKASLWAADLMGYDESAAQNYANDLVALSVQKPTNQDIKRKLSFDLATKGLVIEDAALNQKMDSLLKESVAEMAGSNK